MLFLLAVWGCSQSTPPQEPVRAVKVLTVGADSLHSRLEFAGEVRARVESRLGFRVGGKIVWRQAELGQHVRAGDVLAQLDPQDFELAAQAARAQLAAAVTHRDVAAADYQRFTSLREQNFISAAELQRRESAWRAAQAQVDQAQAQSAVLKHQIEYTTLVSDVAGVVTAVDAEPGQVVFAGAPIFKVAQDGPRDVVFEVPEDKVAQMTKGLKLELRMWAHDTPFEGAVREVAASADPVTRTFGVKASVHPAKEIMPLGATVTVLAHALQQPAATPAIKLPSSALQQAGQSFAVWVLDTASMTVRLQAVELAGADGQQVFIRSGLQPATVVVVAGGHVLSPGQKVSIYQEKTPPPSSVNASRKS